MTKDDLIIELIEQLEQEGMVATAEHFARCAKALGVEMETVAEED